MNLKQIDENLEEGESLKAITQAYSEIANLKIKRIRAEVERNRVFFQEIKNIYALVKDLSVKKKINMAPKPKKTVSIILTSNYRFYGSINSDLIKYFVSSTQKLDTDRIMVNKAAFDYFKAQPIFKNYQEVILKGDQPDTEELLSLVNLVKNYKQVLVFYSSMKSLLNQTPTVVDITATSPVIPTKVGIHTNNENFKFIFEPELSKILEFFDSQIITLLLEGTFLESELSRTASRFISMDQAETSANKFIKEYQTLRAYVKRNMDNNAILENFASMMAVRHE
ncbi:hypothetical protein A3J19_01740 [Candidatus Daviesbacteria bacterium RIFCSPLOWO2_02_FULL_41_8]|uniref:ATP synthase F1 subunit gamma n=2 Tax=Candidatus Daviesiibacteriota TaxID=1752718 RepID=A0A1F5NM05_9BACT|nr:MAG: hypothetical protein A3D83_04710 [Candidatus Daviesbacteria bacterium RIFCSPHIGHO2_02_FULL_41_10]OGE78721.1 MAG: hypothetical protein A3J19_01740 [Candidatus Daviesbacteria bacterium RIFCSPLOWO2_02_FULL_41_8]